MSMGRRKNEIQNQLWVDAAQLQSRGHAFFERLNEVLGFYEFDRKVEELCEAYYSSEGNGRPSIAPGVYFRMLMVGYFEGLTSERSIAWRCQDSLSLRQFLGLAAGTRVPDHSSLTRIRQRLDPGVYKSFQKLVLEMLGDAGLLKGRQLALDSTVIQAEAAMSSIVRRDTNQSYAKYVKQLAKEAGDEPTRAGAARVDRNREGRTTSNRDWVSTTDPEARVARMKDGRTRLAYKTEHLVDLESGAIVAATVNSADRDDRQTLVDTVYEAEENLDSLSMTVVGTTLVADKGYHSSEVLMACESMEISTCIAEPKSRYRRNWKGPRRAAKSSCYANRRRVRSEHGKALLRKRGELVERGFEHICNRGGFRRTRLRGRENNEKRYGAQVASFNLGLILRFLIGVGTPKRLAEVCGAALRRFVATLVAQSRPRLSHPAWVTHSHHVAPNLGGVDRHETLAETAPTSTPC